MRVCSRGRKGRWKGNILRALGYAKFWPNVFATGKRISTEILVGVGGGGGGGGGGGLLPTKRISCNQ